MTKPPEYAKLVEQAERSVAGVKDPELKRIAFQSILENLLSDGGKQEERASGKRRGGVDARSRKPKRGPRAYLYELVEDGFFKKPRTIAMVQRELQARGHHIPQTSLSGPLQHLCQSRKLRRERVKGTSGAKQTFSYSNW